MAIKKSGAKNIKEAVDESEIIADDNDITDASEEEIEDVAEEEIEDIDETAASDTLKPNSMPVGPANKSAAIAKIVNALAAMDADTINHYASVVPTVSKAAKDGVKDVSAKNKASIDAKHGEGKDFEHIMGEETEADISENIKKIISEDVDSLFKGEDLNPEFKERMSVLIESVVNLNTSKRVAELEEEYEQALVEQVSEIQTQLVEALENYLDATVDVWLDQNEVAIVSTLKSDLTEQFIEGLHKLFTENYITVPEDRTDVVEEMSEQIEELKAIINATLEERYELEKELEAKELEIEESKVIAKIAELSEGLSQSDKERFLTLTENVEYEDLDDFVKKATVLKESLSVSDNKNKDTKVLFEENEVIEDSDNSKKNMSPAMASYVKALENIR